MREVFKVASHQESAALAKAKRDVVKRLVVGVRQNRPRGAWGDPATVFGEIGDEGVHRRAGEMEFVAIQDFLVFAQDAVAMRGRDLAREDGPGDSCAGVRAKVDGWRFLCSDSC